MQSGYFLRLFVAVALAGAATMHVSAPVAPPSPLGSLRLEGRLSFDESDLSAAARDFGNRRRRLPAAVVRPASASDVAATVRHVFRQGGARSGALTVAARGHGHSLHGQAQAAGGVVMLMESLAVAAVRPRRPAAEAYVDASSGALWIDVLRESLKQGMAPRSWTDYLHLTVGGTLSNAGVSGQAFRHGPQISNVLQLEVVTGLRLTN